MPSKRKRAMPRRHVEPQMVLTESRADRWWKWGGRACLAAAPVFAGLWWIFGWYNGVEGLKPKIEAVTTKVEKLWEGQTTVLENQKTFTETLKRIEPIIEKVAAQQKR